MSAQATYAGARPFGSLLVANRGEIAIRVLRAARTIGLRTVAVYSDADREAPHVREADTAIRLGPAPASSSYLSVRALLDAARVTGAEAVHPGYGFLSERAAFARAVTEAGLVFVGPPADVIELMGRKDEARRVAQAAGVPVVPAVEARPGAPESHLIADAIEQVGFPMLVKATAGGGGKGMRVVRRAADLPDALAAARREALSAFADDAVLIERFVERGRHVEVQVLADAHGHVVHLFERDCSVQRRHQKVVEEAPAPTISPGLREVVTSAAVRLARAVGYVNAGTVEFLVDQDGAHPPDGDSADAHPPGGNSADAHPPGGGERAYFLEMNTRLQVEHPVTELVTGLDLVRLQLDVAAGRPLPVAQPDITPSGHAVEVRVYAEDADAGFLPQAGVASTVRWTERARVDAALESGQRVGTWYDPMLGKIIASGVDRAAARQALVAALDDTAVLGLTTNLGFLRRLVSSAAYRDADIDTGWLDRHLDPFPPPAPDLARCAAAWTLASPPPPHFVSPPHRSHLSDHAGMGVVDGAGGFAAHHPFGTADGWRLSGPPAPVAVELEHRGLRTLLRVHTIGNRIEELGGNPEADRRWEVHPLAAGPGRLRLDIDGVGHDFVVEVGRHAVRVAHHGEALTFLRPDTLAVTAEAAAASDLVIAPMPGVVLAVPVEPGQAVRAGDVVVVLEAMKMELALKAPHDGTVTAVEAAVGAQVPLGQRLVTVTATVIPTAEVATAEPE